jgi:hypothetical protein
LRDGVIVLSFDGEISDHGSQWFGKMQLSGGLLSRLLPQF